MKKYILGLAVLAGLALTSCDKDNVSTIYSSDAQNISFAEDNASALTKGTSVTVPVQITRSNTAEEYTVHYTLSTSDSGVFTDQNNGTATFAKGEWSTTINVVASNMEVGVEYTCDLILSDADANTGDTVLGTDNYTKSTITVMRDYDWASIGYGFYSSPVWWEAEFDVEIEQATGTSAYKIKDLFDEGYDIQFTINSDNSVVVKPQASWYYSGYGDVILQGDLYEDDSYIAGKYNPATNTISLTLKHILPAAGDYVFGTFTDTLTMP